MRENCAQKKQTSAPLEKQPCRARVMRTIPLADIRLDGDTQVRPLDEDNAVRLQQVLREGGEFLEPPRVVFDGTDFWGTHGFHRLEAYKREGRTEIGVEVVGGTLEDARDDACRPYNAAHGKPETAEEKRARVEAYIARHPKKSLRGIAEWCGTNKDTVRRLRGKSGVSIETPDKGATVRGKDGKKYPANRKPAGLTAASKRKALAELPADQRDDCMQGYLKDCQAGNTKPTAAGLRKKVEARLVDSAPCVAPDVKAGEVEEGGTATLPPPSADSHSSIVGSTGVDLGPLAAGEDVPADSEGVGAIPTCDDPAEVDVRGCSDEVGTQGSQQFFRLKGSRDWTAASPELVATIEAQLEPIAAADPGRGPIEPAQAEHGGPRTQADGACDKGPSVTIDDECREALSSADLAIKILQQISPSNPHRGLAKQRVGKFLGTWA